MKFQIVLLCMVLIAPFGLNAQQGVPPGSGGTQVQIQNTDNTPVTESGGDGGKGTGITYECVQKGAGPGGTDVYGNCGWDNLIAAIKKFFDVAIPMALTFTVVIIAYAGFLYMTSGSNASQRSQANGMFVKVAIGIFFMLGAWLIVTLITNSLLNDSVKVLVPLK